MTVTGLIGRICMFPLRLIIKACVALRIHPNILTFVGVLINVAAAFELARGHFVRGGLIMVVANIFDFIDGKVALELNAVSAFGGFWDSVVDRFSDIALFMIGAFTNRMAAVMWVIGLLSLFTVADRIIYTYRALRDAEQVVA